MKVFKIYKSIITFSKNKTNMCMHVPLVPKQKAFLVSLIPPLEVVF